MAVYRLSHVGLRAALRTGEYGNRTNNSSMTACTDEGIRHLFSPLLLLFYDPEHLFAISCG